MSELKPCTPSVSIVLATYNGARYLLKQLNSLVEQDVLPLEIIVSDDGSNDSTIAIVEAFRETTKIPVIVHRNPINLGYSQNFMAACQLAQGDLIAFCDQDDIWYRDKISRCVAVFARPEIYLCAHAADLIDGDDSVIGQFKQGITCDADIGLAVMDPWGVYWGFTMVFRRRLLEIFPAAQRGVDVHDQDRLLAHDRWIYFAATALGDVHVIAKPLAGYRQHGKNLFGSGASSSGVGRYLFNFRRRLSSTVSSDLVERGRLYLAIARNRCSLLRNCLADSNHIGPSEFGKVDQGLAVWMRETRTAAFRLSLYERVGRISRLAFWTWNILRGVYWNGKRPKAGMSAAGRDFMFIFS